jgi:hypothetical protein
MRLRSLRYIWIKGLQDGKGERIHVPTEQDFPFLKLVRPELTHNHAKRRFFRYGIASTSEPRVLATLRK